MSHHDHPRRCDVRPRRIRRYRSGSMPPFASPGTPAGKSRGGWARITALGIQDTRPGAVKPVRLAGSGGSCVSGWGTGGSTVLTRRKPINRAPCSLHPEENPWAWLPKVTCAARRSSRKRQRRAGTPAVGASAAAFPGCPRRLRRRRNRPCSGQTGASLWYNRWSHIYRRK